MFCVAWCNVFVLRFLIVLIAINCLLEDLSGGEKDL